VSNITVLIVSSSLDPASINIKERILEQSDWKEIDTFYNNPVYQHLNMEDIVIITINDRKIRHENLEKEIKEKLKLIPKQAIFISRHTSKTGEPTLTTHPIGNYGDAQFGGKTKTLSKSSPRLMTHLLRILKSNAKQAGLYHKVCFEVTHHGPYMSIPTLFAEVGSNKEEWIKKEPATIVAKSVLALLSSYHYEDDFTDDIPVLVGIGGGHYAPRFTDVALEKKIAFGHMIPSYHIDAGNINDEMFEKVLKATPNVKGIYFHKKALKKSQVSKYKEWFQNRGLPVVSSKDLPDLD
jgi:D-aminoacyl-tRNA deacylase